MATSLQTVRRLTIESRTVGVDESSQKLARLGQAQDSVAASSERAARQAGAYERALANQQRSIDLANQAYLEMARDRAALAAAMQQQVAANDNVSRSFTVAGLEAAEMANHLRTLGTAAYAFSPAFREVVNGMAAPALKLAGGTLIAVAGGMVTATNLAGTGLVRLGSSAALASASLTPVAGAITSAGLAMQAFNPSLAGVATTILGRVLPALRLLGAVGFIVNAAQMLGEAWRLGGEELDRYRKIAEDAAKVDLSSTYFQKLIKGAEDAKVPVDALTSAFQNLQKASADQLGGSALQNRLEASVKAGNFAGNSGVQLYAQANTTQQRFEAIVSLINQAMTSGQRLAALDIAGTAFGPEVVNNLRQDSEYLDKIKAAADKVAEKDLVSAADVGRALDLQRRYDDAVKILETRWHPIQGLLTQMGVEFRANWVSTVEKIAEGVDWAGKLVAKLEGVPSWFQRRMDQGAQWFAELTTTPESREVTAKEWGVVTDKAELAKDTDVYADAVARLRAGLQSQAEQQQKMNEASSIAHKTLGDTSKAITGAQAAVQEEASAYERAQDALQKHTARMQADMAAVGLGAGALEEYRARAALKTAAIRDDLPMTAALTAAINSQARAAGQAGEALARMRIQSSIQFDKKTLGLSDEDVRIAQALVPLYGNDVTKSLNSAEAGQMRLNNRMRESHATMRLIGDAAVNFGENLAQALASGKSGLDALLPALSSFGSSLTSIGTDSLKSGISGMLKGLGTTGFDPVSLGIGAAGMGISLVADLIGGNDKKRKELEAAQAEWKKAGPAFQTFLLEMSGGVQGDLSKRIQSAQQQFVDLSTKAEKAGDQAAIARMAQASISYQINQAKQFAATFDATVRGMSTGFGPDSPFLQAVNNVKSQLETALSFIDDVRTSNSTSGVLDMGAAINASFSFLTSLLGAAPKLSEVQTGLQKIEGTANALQGALEQLGVSSDAAAVAIRDGVARAMDDLRKTFTEGLTSRLNTATGKSYYNDAAALLVQYQQDIADAAALGIDASLVSAVFRAEAQKIIEDAGLVGDAFTDFTRQFSALAGVVTESSDALAAAAKTQRDALNASAKSIVEYVNGLMTGSQAGLSPQDRFTAAQSAYNQKLALAQGGNADAMASIAQDFETYRSAAREMFGSTEQYQQILAAGINQLLTLPAVQQTTDPVVQAMRDVLLAVQAGNSTLVNVQTATQLNVAKTAEAAAQAQRTADLQASANSLTDTSNSLAYTANVILDQQNSFLNSINNLQATATSQLALLQNALAPTSIDVRSPEFGNAVLSNQAVTALNKIVWNTFATTQNLKLLASNSYQHGPLPGTQGGVYAQGGLVTGPGTGTSDSIPAWLSNREFVIPNAQVERLGVDFFEQIRSGRTPMMPMPVPVRAGNDNGDWRAVLDELRELKARLASIEGNTGRTASVAAASGEAIRGAVERGNDELADMNKRLRRA